ncbi:Putative multidrug export ATP-binding/permease protein [Clostridiales bacterium CHKCI001]|nr:Putative multidrug export ATP-binding/permease protein [Clostridiales bacterium CHKCI001]
MVLKEKSGNLFYFMKKQWPFYLIGFFTMSISIFLDMQAPGVIQRIIDEVIVKRDTGPLLGLVLTLLGIGVGRAVFQYMKEFSLDYAGTRVGKGLRLLLFEHIQGLDISYFDKTNTGELMARVKDDIDKIWGVTGFIGMFAVECVIHTISVLYCMFRISPVLTIIPLVIMPLVAITALKMEHNLGKIYEDISEQNALLNTIAQENLAGVRTVRAFARENYEIQKFQEENQNYYALNMRQARAIAKYQPNISFFTKIILIAVVICGGLLVMNNTITIGSLGAFTEYATNIIWPMECIGWITNDIASAYASYKKIQIIMGEESEIQNPNQETKVKLQQKTDLETGAEIEFDHVGLELDGKRILSEIQFHVHPGQTLGIMGMTGSGKSTIIHLLERFYDVTDGTIRIDGIDIREMDLKMLRQKIALVMQEVFLFSDTIKENIRIGKRTTMSEEVISQAAWMAGAGNFIEKLSNGYETVVGERGVGLSGGQKQRISIARALSKKAPILVLDDSTSALDMETEASIQKRLKELRGMTKIVIAHRISSVRHADEILILENGRIVERGNHEQLMAKRGFYYHTYCIQYDKETAEAAITNMEKEVNIYGSK